MLAPVLKSSISAGFDANGSTNLDDGRHQYAGWRGRASLWIEFKRARRISPYLHPPRRLHEDGQWHTRQRFVSKRTSSTTRCSLSVPIDNARRIARSRWTAMGRRDMKNEWSR